MMPITLYGSPMSLYTARVRSYFIKAGLSFREVAPVSRHYEEVILPKAGGRRSMPTVELEDGSVIRDSVAIIDYFEARNNFAFSPRTTCQQLISLLFDLIGAEGMYRPAMHYRWRYNENKKLVTHHFEEITPLNASYQFTVVGRFERMLKACDDLGVPQERIALVESLYLRLLRELDAHFKQTPYLLGGKPSIGDFGFAAPMSAHLGRDIVPLSLLHEHAPYVLRWIERMQRPDPGFSACHQCSEEFLQGDEIPDTLISVLRHIALDFMPETEAACRSINEWLSNQEEELVGKEVERGIGEASFSVEGNAMIAGAQPFRFYLLARLQTFFSKSSEDDRKKIQNLLAACDMAELLDHRLIRDIGRDRNLEIWL